MSYQIKREGSTLSVTQTAPSTIIFALIYLLGCVTGLYLTVFSRVPGSDLIVAGLFLSGLAMICLVIALPYRVVTAFDQARQELRIVRKSVLRNLTESYQCKSLSTIQIKTVGRNAAWFTPVIEAEDGTQIKIGFGSSNRQTIEKLIQSIGEGGPFGPPSA